MNIVLISLACLWLFAHLSVTRRLKALADRLPDAYGTANAAPLDDAQDLQLVGLAIDLMRKQHANVPFDDLDPNERRVALFAFAVETLPGWMVRYAMIRLRGSEKALINQLRQIKTSRPEKRQRHFGAIQTQKQLRPVAKN